MGIFDRFPYSSTHEMNLDFMLGKATEIAESLQEIDTHKEQAEQAATNAAQSAQSAAQAAQATNASATAAEQHKTDAEDAADRAEAAWNGADATYEKLVNDTLNFVTPEMYEAKGDGTTDDTIALQNAINSGSPVFMGNKTYKITETLIIENPTFIYCNNTTIVQSVFSLTSGGFQIESDNVNILGKLSIELSDTKTQLQSEATQCSGIRFYKLSAVKNFYFEDISIKGFIGGIVFQGSTISNLFINRLYLEHVDFGLWGSKVYDAHIIELEFKYIDHSQSVNDPTHVVYLTGASQSIQSANITIDRCIGEYCNTGIHDSVFSIKCTSNFYCKELVCKNVSQVFTTLYSSGTIENFKVSNVTDYAISMQYTSPDENPFIVKNGFIDGIAVDTENVGITSISGSAIAIFENVSYKGYAKFGTRLSDCKYTEKNCTYINTGNTMFYAYEVVDSDNSNNLIIEPTLTNIYLAHASQDREKTKFILNPAKYNGVQLSDGGGVSNFEFVDNNVFITTADYSYNEWFNNNMIVTLQPVRQLRGEGLHILKNGATVDIAATAKLILKDGATSIGGSAWQMAWFYVKDTIAYEIAHI